MGDFKVFSKAVLEKQREERKFQKGFNLSEHLRYSGENDKQGTIWEFVGTGDFAAVWNERQQYEVDAGRDLEPLLYQPFYQTQENADFPRSVTINDIGPGGVFFSQIPEGGEIPFASIGESSRAIPILDWAVILRYSETLVRYNELWDVSIFERQAGIAHNALMNHLHLSPFISATYAAANQTAASAIGTTLREKYLRTLEDAVTNAKGDATNRKRGPYMLLVSSSNEMTMGRALAGGDIIGADLESPARAQIRGMVVYDGWEGTMSGKDVSYAGVSANKAYLIDVSVERKTRYARSLVKFLMDRTEGNPDISRMMAAQIRYWSAIGIYTSPLALAEEVTLPTS